MSPFDAWKAEVIDVVGNVDHVVATARLTGERRGIKVRMHGARVFRLDGDFRIVEAWGFVADQAALDELFRAKHRRDPGGGCFMPPISS